MERLLYIPNEVELGQQRGPRRVFESLMDKGELEAYKAFALPYEFTARGSAARALDDLERMATDLQPTLVLWQHIMNSPIPASFHRRIRNLDSQPLVAFQDIDPYGWVRKPLPKASRRLVRQADVVYLCGLGSFARIFRFSGAGRVRYTSHGYDPERFALPWEPTPDRAFDVVMIGNRITSRVPGRRIPGNRKREQLAGLLHERFGSRFACFGNGWAGFPYDRGPVSYDRQGQINRSAWVTVGWDHFTPTPYYFSDRLPIALASGVAHVTSFQPGYEAMFPREHGLFWAASIHEAVNTVTWLLEQPRQYLLDQGANAAELARTRLNQHSQLVDLIGDLSTLRSQLHTEPGRRRKRSERSR